VPASACRRPNAQTSSFALRSQNVLSQRSFRENARRLAADFARYGGAAQAAGLLEDLAIRRRDCSQSVARVSPSACCGEKARPPVSNAIHAVMSAQTSRSPGASI